MLSNLFLTVLILIDDTKVFSILLSSYILGSQLQKCMVEKLDVCSNFFRLNI